MWRLRLASDRDSLPRRTSSSHTDWDPGLGLAAIHAGSDPVAWRVLVGCILSFFVFLESYDIFFFKGLG